MIITEYPYNGNENLIKTASDNGLFIRQVETGTKYDIAIDVYPPRYTYEETEEIIETEGREVTGNADS